STGADSHHSHTYVDLLCPRPSILEIAACVAPTTHPFPSRLWLVLPISDYGEKILVVGAWRVSIARRAKQDLPHLSDDSFHRVGCLSLRRSLRGSRVSEVCGRPKHLTNR